MCGLVFVLSKKKITQSRIKDTLKEMKSRGPDAQSFIEEKIKKNNLLFLFSRLSIIDLNKRSNQPFKKKNCILIFNGEIYNFCEIKNFLKSKKIIFKTNSDTEVLLESYKYWGEKFVNQLNGMWSFVLYDKKEKKIIISRDKYSEKPLFYFADKNRVIFASETKYIKSILPNLSKINKEKIKENIQYGYKSLFLNSDFFWKHIKTFPANGFLKINLEEKINFRIKKKISIKSNNIFSDKKKLNTRNLLIDSLKIRMRSDVPIAFSLSGGIDSNILAGIASKIFNEEIFSYSILDLDPRYNEKKMIDYVVKKNKYNHKYINISSYDHFLELIKVTKYFNSPIPTINFLVQNYLMKEVHKDKKKVLISGIGADEIFTGYYHHYNFYFNEHGKKFSNNYQKWRSKILPNVRNKKFQEVSKLDKKDYLHDDNRYLIKRPNKKFLYPTNRLSNDNLKNRLLNELYFDTVPVMTYSEDLNSMMYSVENRNPYLDKNLINYVNSINSKNYIQNGFSKYLLRSSFQDLGINKIINNYNKTGFNYSFRTLFPSTDKRILNFIKKKSLLFNLIKKDETVKLFEKNKLNDVENKLAFSVITTKVFLDYCL